MFECVCGYWELPENNYYVKNDEIVELHSDNTSNSKDKIYPSYSDMKTDRCLSMEFGNAYSWEETHWCPNCKKEFSFVTSSV